MLQTSKPPVASSHDRQKPAAGSLVEAFQALAGLLRRQYPTFIVMVLCTLGLGIFYLALTTPVFTATAAMTIDTRKVQQYQQQSASVGEQIDAGDVQTQLEVLKSDNISAAVIKDLNLTTDPEFITGRPGVVSRVKGWLGIEPNDPTDLSEADILHRAQLYFEDNCIVTRVPQTYVMNVAFQSLDPTKAARIANAIVDAYITDQLEAKFQSTKRASLWLQERIAELRGQATQADRAVVDFKTTNNIVAADGRLVNEQQLTEVNSQLILAHAATAEAKARLDRITEVMKQPIPDASIADALKSEIIIRLRQQYLELAGREAIWSVRYGANHLATQNLRTQMIELQHNIADEMRKIAESYKSDYAIAQARETSLADSLKTSVSEAQTSNQAQVQLRDLLSNSQSSRQLYESFLQRYLDAVQQQSFPMTEARIISPAVRPFTRSKPTQIGVIGAALVSGLMLGFGIAVFREMADRVFRSGTRVEETLQLDCLATLPVVRKTKPPKNAPPAGPRDIVIGPGLWRYAVDRPFSAFTEALRSIKIAADLAAAGRSSTVLGVTSTLPNEGKSTIAANFAALMSHAGARVLLIDADLRSPSLSRILAPQAAGGLVDIINGTGTLDDLVRTDPASKLSFLPAGAAPKLVHTNEILGSEAMRTFFAAIRPRYDYILVDLAPLAPVVDTRATVGFIDAYVYAVEWGRTKIDVVEDVLSSAREVQDNILGVVLNKADLSILGRYERHRGKSYHRKFYRRYGYTT